MQTAQQHARGSGARLALSLLTASRATPSRHAPGAVAEQEVLLDPLQRLAGIGELVAALRSLRFCSASSAFSCFFPTWPPGSPAPVPRQPRSRTGRLFYMAIRLCSGAAHASQPRPAGPRPPRAALAPPPCGDAGLFWNSGPSPPYAPTAPPTAAFGPSAMCSSTPPLPPKGEPKEPPAPLAFDLSSPFKRRKAEFPAPHAAQGGQWSPQVHPRPNNEISINFLTNQLPPPARPSSARTRLLKTGNQVVAGFYESTTRLYVRCS